MKWLLPALLLSARLCAQSSELFVNAYQECPSLPKGILEAVAYQNTHLQPISPTETIGCAGMPVPFGMMGVFDSGNGYFVENAQLIAQLSGISVLQQKQEVQWQILAYAKAMEHLILSEKASNANVSFDEVIFNALWHLSEIPDSGKVNHYAKTVQAYGYLNLWMDAEFASAHHFSPIHLDLIKLFGEENLKILQSKKVLVSSGFIADENGHFFNNNLVKSAEYGPAIWNPSANCNFSSRNGTAVSAVTVHTIQGSYAGAISWSQNCNAAVSYHYVVRSSDGQITQMVHEADKAWHVGSENPYTIGIEHEGFVSDPSWYTEAMYAESAALCRDIVGSGYGINGLRTYFGASSTQNQVLGGCIKIKGHQHYPNQTHTDPGVNWNWEKYYRLINNQLPTTNLTTSSGTFYDSGGSSANYSNDERHGWLIQVSNAGTINLSFQNFSIESGYDFLYVYDGASINAPLLGVFTGNQLPGSIASSGNALFLEFRSDCGTTSSGWTANYIAEPLDTIAPVTQILTVENEWLVANTMIPVFDLDLQKNVDERFYLLADRPAYEESWHANGAKGFAYESFEDTANWTFYSNGFSLFGQQLKQGDALASNTNASLAVLQTNQSVYLYHWDMKFISSELNQRAGLHFFCSNPAMPNRGDSYFVYFREGQNKVEIYKVINDSYTLQHTSIFTIQQQLSYHCGIYYDPQSGWIRVFVNDHLVASWKDSSPLINGNSISFRSGGCQVLFDNLRCFKSRDGKIPVVLMEDFRYLSEGGINTGKAEALCVDSQWNWSAIDTQQYKVDWTGNLMNSAAISAQKVKVFPNPVNDWLYIDGVTTPVQYALLDSRGQLVLVGHLHPHEAIDLSSISAGQYMLEMSINAKVIREKILIQR